MSEIYVSVDIESDGPIPGPNSMLSMGSAAFTGDGKLIGTHSANFDLLAGAVPDLETMEFWGRNKEAWEECRKDTKPAEEIMPKYAEWLEALPGKPVFVGYPAGYDFLFVYWYLRKFAKRSPFGFQALDIKTYSMAVLGTDFKGTTKRTMPKHWFSNRKHTHVAVDDAIEQGELFCNILKENLKRMGK